LLIRFDDSIQWGFSLAGAKLIAVLGSAGAISTLGTSKSVTFHAQQVFHGNRIN
jgi:hypothetical protein